MSQNKEVLVWTQTQVYVTVMSLPALNLSLSSSCLPLVVQHRMLALQLNTASDL